MEKNSIHSHEVKLSNFMIMQFYCTHTLTIEKARKFSFIIIISSSNLMNIMLIWSQHTLVHVYSSIFSKRPRQMKKKAISNSIPVDHVRLLLRQHRNETKYNLMMLHKKWIFIIFFLLIFVSGWMGKSLIFIPSIEFFNFFRIF